ncbi:MAG: VCBS domain-containing protein, partial [Planctomycetaceae bacterium]|nr:VCBS domain-containing protein [Planctomycetaceae bacterium]
MPATCCLTATQRCRWTDSEHHHQRAQQCGNHHRRDNGQAAFVPQTNVAGSYGTFSIDAAGNWSYFRTADLQSLSVGESASDSFNVVSLDGTASQL